MADDLIKVRLVGPAKVGSRWLKEGDEDVTVEEFEALDGAGLLDPSRDELKALVASSDAKINATFAKQVEQLSAALKDATARAEIADGERNELKAQISHLEGVIADLNGQLQIAHEKLNQSPADAGDAGAADNSMTSPPDGAAAPAATDTPPSEKATKTAPKKGAAATTKG